MHLLAATPGGITDGSEAIDLGQSPGDIVVLSFADTELAALASANATLGAGANGGLHDAPSLRLAPLLHLGHNMSVDLYVESVIAKARLVIVRLLGGRSYWAYGVDEVLASIKASGAKVAFLPGDDQADAELARISSVSTEAHHRLWQYLVHGGPKNASSFLRYAATLIGAKDDEWLEPEPLAPAGLYLPGRGITDRATVCRDWKENRPVSALVFYRALLQAGNLDAVDALIEALSEKGLNVLPLFVQSLKDPVSAALVGEVLSEDSPDVIVNTTGFAVSAPGATRTATPFDEANCPVLQAVFAGSSVDSWRGGDHGLVARDIAMNVALPEIDGRIMTRAVSFKGLARRDDATQCDIVLYEPVPDRIDFVAEQAFRWGLLRISPEWSRRIGLVLANYPNKNGRIGNGVGLDTPKATINILRALAAGEYDVEDIPESGEELIARLIEGTTNDGTRSGPEHASETLSLEDYETFFATLPESLRSQVTARWGAPQTDAFMRPDGTFAIPAFLCGNVAVCLQPARGYNIDPKETYHSPDLVPPHGYLAFYAWLRHEFDADAIVHVGKHGNLEWLPGKSLALSETCYPEAALGPMPHFYPFIVNDPGEGTQAKRRTSAVIIDHLTPPLTRAESYGAAADLERLVDEYFEAAGVDPRRLKLLGEQILDAARASGLAEDCGIEENDDKAEALRKIDGYLCELKEAQIRDGLHILGESPAGDQLTDLLAALVRVPRGTNGADASLTRALARDLGLSGFDPLTCDFADGWSGAKPDALAGILDAPWRTAGDGVERLEVLAGNLIAGRTKPASTWTETAMVLAEIEQTIRPAVAQCGPAEMGNLLRGLNGSFIAPGPSGAPTRGRVDVLPTGRNFYSVDLRALPTPAAWTLGWKSATLLIERHTQDTGEWPRSLALSAWGTSNMRTGGDDIAQALAMMGVRPQWDTASRRVTGFEIMPADVLGRPRVDVTLRISGFFRDAFPNLIDLFDSAVRAVAALDEPIEQNPLAARVRAEAQDLVGAGMDADVAERQAASRVFGSKPGAYGAGLQALIDEKGWETDVDLAGAYVAWGGYAYGDGQAGVAAHKTFETRLKTIEAVVQNQDNREHDILDSDDYYQFEGGITAAVRTLSGAQPQVYHPDHSRPENPRIRTLEEEMARVVRSRAANPKWIEGVMRHGYKGAFEMAATVDYLFAFAATAKCVKDHHFDMVYDAYLADDRVRDFMAGVNPDALRDMAERFIEALDRHMWKPKSNSARAQLEEWAKTERKTK